NARGADVPIDILLVGAVGIAIGLATYGYRALAALAESTTDLTPTRGFSAEFSAATTIMMASQLGIPVSTTHTLIGSVIGVGFARSTGAINLRVLRGLALSWAFTIPATALLTTLMFVAMRPWV